MPICEVCHAEGPTKEFYTSGAMHRGVQFCWGGKLCASCLEKVGDFKLDIVADPPPHRCINPVYEMWRHGASDEQINEFIRGELARGREKNPC